MEKRADKGDTPYNLRNCAYMDDFYKQKIVWKRIGSILRFSYDDTGALALDSTCFATGENIKYLLLILNSRLGKYLMKDSPQTGTGDLLISVQAIEPLKIPIPNNENIELFINLFDSLFYNLKNNFSINEIEKNIDFNIYKVYNFTTDEIEFIETQ